MNAQGPASVKARLLVRARARREEFERTLVQYAEERLLYRLGVSPARESCILKGASLLAAWMPDPYRITRDIDLLSFGSSEDAAIRILVEEICAVPCPEDGLQFDLSELVVEEIRRDDKYPGKRALFLAFLGKARIRIHVDVGFGDALAAAPEEIEYPTILSGLPVSRLRAYPREASVAEKFEAMVSLNTRNSRMKDFHDVWALSDRFAFDGPSLLKAVAACFERRRTPRMTETPGVLTPAFYKVPAIQMRWRGYLAAGSVYLLPPVQFEVIGERIMRFFSPVWDCFVGGTSFSRRWEPGGPWR